MNSATIASTPRQFHNQVIEDSSAEIAALDEAFWLKIAAQQAAADQAREAGIPALKRLFELAETRDSGQMKIIASVLAGCYNGRRFRVNLQDFRVLDAAILDDVLAVIRMDSSPEMEVQEYFEQGGQRFEKMFKKFGLKTSKDE